jgi:hypothetical protein
VDHGAAFQRKCLSICRAAIAGGASQAEEWIRLVRLKPLTSSKSRKLSGRKITKAHPHRFRVLGRRDLREGLANALNE